MKKIILIFIVLSVIFSCTEEQNNTYNNNIGENFIETEGNIKINLLENQPDL